MSADSVSYKHVTATGLVYTGATQLYGIILTGGSDAATLTLYDWTSATGGGIVTIMKAATNATVSKTFDKPVNIRSGVYAVLAGTGPIADFYMDGSFSTTSTSTSSSTTTTSTSTTTTSTSTTSTSTTTTSSSTTTTP